MFIYFENEMKEDGDRIDEKCCYNCEIILFGLRLNCSFIQRLACKMNLWLNCLKEVDEKENVVII